MPESRVRDVYLAFWTKAAAAETVAALAAEHFKGNRSDALREIMKRGIADVQANPPVKEKP